MLFTYQFIEIYISFNNHISLLSIEHFCGYPHFCSIEYNSQKCQQTLHNPYYKKGRRNFSHAQLLSGFIFSIYTLSILYPIPICVCIYCGELTSFSIFFLNVAINTLSDARSFSHELPHIFLVI